MIVKALRSTIAAAVLSTSLLAVAPRPAEAIPLGWVVLVVGGTVIGYWILSETAMDACHVFNALNFGGRGLCSIEYGDLPPEGAPQIG